MKTVGELNRRHKVGGCSPATIVAVLCECARCCTCMCLVASQRLVVRAVSAFVCCCFLIHTVLSGLCLRLCAVVS